MQQTENYHYTRVKSKEKAMDVGKTLDIPENTVKRFLLELKKAGVVITHGHDQYAKKNLDEGS